MKILYLSQRYPYPPDRGDRIPVFNHIKHLAKSHEVHVASLMPGPEELGNVEGMRPWVKSSTVECHPRWKSAFGKVGAFGRGEPLSLGHYYSPALHRRVRDLVAREGIEAVVVFSSSMAQYVQDMPGLVRVMNFCDMDSQKWLTLSRKSAWPRSWIYRREAKVLLEYERRIARDFDASCLVTENEAKVFRELIPGSPVSVVANGVDHEFFGAVERHPKPRTFAFVGVMDYEPNIEAVQYFATRIWPRVLRKWPDAAFTIVGARPTAAVRRLERFPGVEVTGFVKDVRAYLASTHLVVVPLSVARGVQNKVLEAMAAGAPVLTTPGVLGGLASGAQNALLIAERETDAFFEKMVEAVENPEVLKQKAELARRLVRECYSWEASGESLEALIRAAAVRRNLVVSEPSPAAADVAAVLPPVRGKVGVG